MTRAAFLMQAQIWLLQNGAVASTTALPLNSPWSIAYCCPFDGDKDVLYTQSNGQQYAIYLNGTTQTGGGFVSGKTADAVQALTVNEGTDTVQSSIGWTLASGVENLTLTGTGNINGTGNAAANVIVGNAGNNVLTGLGGVDTLTGGAGIDTFAFAGGDTGSTTGSRDLVTDFTVGTDLIDLTGIDADTGVAGINAFRWLGTAAFDGQAGGLRYFFDASRGVTVVEGDTNGDNIADFGIDLTGNKNLSAAQFTSASLQAPPPGPAQSSLASALPSGAGPDAADNCFSYSFGGNSNDDLINGRSGSFVFAPADARSDVIADLLSDNAAQFQSSGAGALGTYLTEIGAMPISRTEGLVYEGQMVGDGFMFQQFDHLIA